MKINKLYEPRIYPSNEQIALPKQCVKNTHSICNLLLNLQQDYSEDNKEYLSDFDLNYFIHVIKKRGYFRFRNNQFSQLLFGKVRKEQLGVSHRGLWRREPSKILESAYVI